MRGKVIKKILSGAGILAACSVLAKLLGAFFRVPLTNIVGAEGMGLYQMVFPLYTVLLTLTSGGISGAISKIAAQNQANKRNLRKILWVSIVCVSLVSSIAAAFLFVFKDSIAAMQGNIKAGLAYGAIAPAIILVSLISCFRGYFQGLNNMLFSGISQLLEQSVKLVLGLYLAAKLLPFGVEYAVLGAVLGITASELSALLYLLMHYLFSHFLSRRKSLLTLKRFNRLVNSEAALDVKGEYFFAPSLTLGRSGEVAKSLYKVALPITLGSLIMPLTQVIDSVMVINVLAQFGVSRGEATALFGLLSGPISSLINMPLVITLAFSVALLPKIAASLGSNDKKTDSLIAMGIKNVLIFSLPCAAVFFFFSREIIELLYSSGLTDNQVEICSILLKIESISIIFVGLIQISSSSLQGADRAARPAINMLLGAIAKVLLTLLLLPILGIIGAAIASSLCYLLTASLDLASLRRLAKIKPSFLPIAGAVLLIIFSRPAYLILSAHFSLFISLFISLFFGGAIYLGFLMLTKSIKISDLLG